MAANTMRSGGTLVLVVMLSVVIAAASASSIQAKPMRDYPRLAGGLPTVEGQILEALQTAELTDRIREIAANTNGHLIVAGLVLAYSPSLADPLPALQAYAWRLVRTVFTSVPALDEIDLTEVRPDTSTLDATTRPTITFSAAIGREEFLRVQRGLPASEKFAMFPRVWYRAPQPQSQPGNVEPSSASVPPVPLPTRRALISTPRTETHTHLRDSSILAPHEQRVAGEIYRGDPAFRTAAVTFDDGPFPIYTTLLLDTLDRLGVKATFFLVGREVQAYPYFALAIVRAGHEIANHTFNHVNLTRLSAEQVAEEITRAQKTITDVIGQPPRYFRPPGGNYNSMVLRAAHNAGLVTVFWTANSADYTGLDNRALEARVLSRVSNGGIILFHQGTENTLWTLPHVTTVLRSQGYAFTTVSGLVARRGLESTPRIGYRRKLDSVGASAVWLFALLANQ